MTAVFDPGEKSRASAPLPALFSIDHWGEMSQTAVACPLVPTVAGLDGLAYSLLLGPAAYNFALMARIGAPLTVGVPQFPFLGLTVCVVLAEPSPGTYWKKFAGVPVVCPYRIWSGEDCVPVAPATVPGALVTPVRAAVSASGVTTAAIPTDAATSVRFSVNFM